MTEILPGTILIADPFLKDPNFIRSVVFVCEHESAGSFGFVINRPYEQTIGDVLPELSDCNIPLYYGGPVQQNTLHFLHTIPDLIGGVEVGHGIYWGGDFEKVQELLHTNSLNQKQIRFFIGYSGWTEGQLESEIETKSWILKDASKKLVFADTAEAVWQIALKDLGGEYVQMIHYPIDPQLN